MKILLYGLWLSHCIIGVALLLSLDSTFSSFCLSNKIKGEKAVCLAVSVRFFSPETWTQMLEFDGKHQTSCGEEHEKCDQTAKQLAKRSEARLIR